MATAVKRPGIQLFGKCNFLYNWLLCMATTVKWPGIQSLTIERFRLEYKYEIEYEYDFKQKCKLSFHVTDVLILTILQVSMTVLASAEMEERV